MKEVITYNENISYLAGRTLLEDLHLQIAEECGELIQAVMKLQRALNETNPTPVSADKALDSVLEEIADVRLCLEVYERKHGETAMEEITLIKRGKAKRWKERLERKEE